MRQPSAKKPDATFDIVVDKEARLHVTIKSQRAPSHQTFTLGPYTDDQDYPSQGTAKWMAKQLRHALKRLQESYK